MSALVETLGIHEHYFDVAHVAAVLAVVATIERAVLDWGVPLEREDRNRTSDFGVLVVGGIFVVTDSEVAAHIVAED